MKELPAGYMYTIVMQCVGLVNHAVEEPPKTVRIKGGPWIPKINKILEEARDNDGMEFVEMPEGMDLRYLHVLETKKNAK